MPVQLCKMMTESALDCQGYAIGAGNFATGRICYESTYPFALQDAYVANDWLSRDPVVQNCSPRPFEFTWGVDQSPDNPVMAAASDVGLSHGVSCSSVIAGSAMILSLADFRPLSSITRRALRERVRKMHMDRLCSLAEGLTRAQRETVQMFAMGMRGKQVAHEFGVSEQAIVDRKQRVLNRLEINSFATAIHVCAIAGVTVH